MTITRGNAATPDANGTDTEVLTWAANPTAGQSVIITATSVHGETISSVVDNGTTPTTFTLDATQDSATLNHTVWLFRANNITLPASGSYAVTVNASGGHSIESGGVAYSGVKPGAPTATNVTGISTAGSNSVNTGTVTPSAAGALFVGVFGDDSSVNDSITLTGSGFTSDWIASDGSSYTPGAGAGKIDSGGPTATGCTWILAASHKWLTAIAVYDAAAATSPKGLLMASIV